MSKQGGLGRGLSSLIPQKKNQDVSSLDVRKLKKNEISSEDNSDYFDTLSHETLNKGMPASFAFNDKKNKVVDVLGKKKKNNQFKKTLVGDKKAKFSKKESIREVSIDSVVPSPYQPRKDFDDEGINELSDSIKRHGLIQPLLIVEIGNGMYELIAGERRLRASKVAGLKKVPVIVKDKLDEQKKAELALIENIQRADLSVMEEVQAYKKLQELFALTQLEIAERVGKSRSRIANALRLLNLPIDIQRSLAQGEITEGHARAILFLEDIEKQRILHEVVLEKGLNVRQTEEKARNFSSKIKRIKSKKYDPDLLEKENKVSTSLGTKVKIKKKGDSGQLIIDFYSDEEFETLWSKLI